MANHCKNNLLAREIDFCTYNVIGTFFNEKDTLCFCHPILSEGLNKLKLFLLDKNLGQKQFQSLSPVTSFEEKLV